MLFRGCHGAAAREGGGQTTAGRWNEEREGTEKEEEGDQELCRIPARAATLYWGADHGRVTF